jgi:3-phosphoshikimate 1-carboxyvinyltransferase
MIAALAEGESVLKNFSSARDCDATIECLRTLGVGIAKHGSTVIVRGVGPAGFREPKQELDAQNSGTTMRLLAGILASQPFATTITGDASLLQRPMSRVAEPLRLMGAELQLENDSRAPLHIKGCRPLQSITYQLPIASAQIKSAILLAGLAADGVTTVEEPTKTRDHTERMLPEFGAKLERDANKISVEGGVQLKARDLFIPGDFSSAAFFIAAAIALPESDLFICDVGLNPTRTGFLSMLNEMGANIRVEDERLVGGEPIGSIRVRGVAPRQASPLEVSGAAVSGLIDELPLLAFFSASVGCEMALSDARELRVKESDRIMATVTNLSRMGARIEERKDGWRLYAAHAGRKLRGCKLSSFGDHRIAMACAVAALTAEGPSQIEGARDAVGVSLPEFWSLLESVTE